MGCATCHLPKLGEVDGIYSDLLVHDMGAQLADTGGYGSDPDSPGDFPDEPRASTDRRTRPASAIRDVRRNQHCKADHRRG